MQYVFMEPPFEIKPFNEMNKKEAQAHFAWYLNQIPSRIEMLKEAYEFTNGGDKGDWDYSADSLVKVWEWFIKNAEIIKKTPKELDEETKNMPEWLRHDIKNYKMSSGWLAIAMDISLYFSQCIINSHDQIKWGLITKPKNFISVNKPVLLGFKNNVDLDATLVLHTLTAKVVREEKRATALREVYDVWVGDI